MFGGQSRQNGVQVKWLAPTDLFLEFGAETGNGDGFPGDARRRATASTAPRCLRTSAATSATTRAGAPARAWLDSDAEDREGGIADAPARRCSIRSPATRTPGSWMACSSGRRRRAASSRCRASTCAAAKSGEIARRRRRAAGRRLSQHAVRLVPAERLSVRAALARGRALRLARFGHAALHAARPTACSSAESRPRLADARLESQRVLAPARAVRLGRRARRRRHAIASCACNTSTASARTARTSTRNHSHEELHSIVVVLLMLAAALPAHAALKVLATTPDWGALTHGARRRARQRVRRHHRAAGRASRRGQAQPGGARAQRGPRRRHRRRAGSRLAAGAHPGVRQLRASSRARRATSKRRRRSSCWRCRRSSIAPWATSIRRAIRTCSSIRTTSRPSRRR